MLRERQRASERCTNPGFIDIEQSREWRVLAAGNALIVASRQSNKSGRATQAQNARGRERIDCDVGGSAEIVFNAMFVCTTSRAMKNM